MDPLFYDAYHYFTYTFISLFSIVNPIGMSAVFLTMTQSYSHKHRTETAWRVALYGVILLIVVFFAGSYILSFFGISLAALQVAGGLVVFATSWKMLNAPPKPIQQNSATPDAAPKTDITFFPLTMPMTAGAGSMAVTVALAASLRQDAQTNYIVSHISVTLGICAVFLVVGFSYALADRIFLKLGNTGTTVVTRLSAFILLAVAVSIAWSGIKTLILSLH